MSFVAADFNSDDVPGPLRAAGLDPAAATLFLLEGVAVYLAPDVLERLLGEFRRQVCKVRLVVRTAIESGIRELRRVIL